MERKLMALLLPMLLIGTLLWPSAKVWACEGGGNEMVQVQQQNQVMPGDVPVLATFNSDRGCGTGAGPPIASSEISWVRQGQVKSIIGLGPIATTAMFGQCGRGASNLAIIMTVDSGQCLAIIVTIVDQGMVRQGGGGPPIAALIVLDSGQCLARSEVSIDPHNSLAIREDDDDGGLLRPDLVRCT